MLCFRTGVYSPDIIFKYIPYLSILLFLICYLLFWVGLEKDAIKCDFCKFHTIVHHVWYGMHNKKNPQKTNKKQNKQATLFLMMKWSMIFYTNVEFLIYMYTNTHVSKRTKNRILLFNSPLISPVSNVHQYQQIPTVHDFHINQTWWIKLE